MNCATRVGMEMETGKERFLVLEWSIKNFSCWNYDVHGEVITSPQSNNSFGHTIELFPRGYGGLGEHLVVRLICSNPWHFSGDLSFISSDGTLLCTLQVNSTEKRLIVVPHPGPKFEDVVAQITKNGDLYKDRLTLRFRTTCDSESKNYLRTKIDAEHVFLKISNEILNGFGSIDGRISCLKYPLDEEEIGYMLLSVSRVRTDRKKVLKLQPIHNLNKNVLVLTRMTVLYNEDVVRTAENKHIFRDNTAWVFWKSLIREEESTKGISYVLYLKIIPASEYKHCFDLYQYHPEKVVLIPSDNYRSRGTNVYKDEIPTSVSSSLNKDSAAELTNDFMCLYQDQDFSDLQLTCGNISFPVHRNILSARSPVFKTMLSSDMREAACGTVEIEDLDPSTLGLFLTYLYTGAMEDLQCNSALKLYYAADKYQVPSLKRECAGYLCDNISISMVCDVLSLANRHQDDQLTHVSTDFILKNFNEVLGSGEWKSFMRSEPLLAVETLTNFSDKKYIGRRDAS